MADPNNPDPNQDAQNQDRKNSINQWYNQYGGRNATDAETNQWLGSSNFGTVEDSIRGSFANQPKAQQPAPTWDRAAFVNEWLPTGRDVNAQTAVLQKWGLDPSKMSANGTMTLPDGSIMDMRRGARAGDNTAQWMGIPSQMGGGGGPSGGTPGGSPGNGPLAGGQDERWNALYDQLMKRAGQSLDVNGNDPIIKGQTEAYQADQDRARRGYLNDLAESNGPYASGAQSGAARQTAETLGQNVGSFRNQLMGKELDARRTEIQNALSQAGGMLSDQQRLALQKELGYLNDATQRYGIDTNATTAANRLGLDYANSQSDYWLRSQGL